MGFAVELPVLNWSEVEEKIVSFLRDLKEKTGRKAVIGVSGGVDSATVLALSVKAFGAKDVRAVIMPSQTTPPEDVEDAKELIQKFGVTDWKIININKILKSYEETLGKMNKVVRGNTMARIRMTILYALAHEDGLVIGTGDKSELLLGYFTKYGDGAVDVLPIGDLYKTWVRKLALHLGIPEKIALKPSSPRLWSGQLAEEELGIKYEVADVILYGIVDEGLTPREVIEKYGVPEDAVRRVIELMKKNQHKLLPPPIVKVGKRTAFEFAPLISELEL